MTQPMPRRPARQAIPWLAELLKPLASGRWCVGGAETRREAQAGEGHATFVVGIR
jgi:hypothetical protein